MDLGHLLTCSGLTYPEVSSKACHDSFCQLGNTVSLPWVIYCEAFYLHVVSRFSCIPVICLKLLLFLTPLQFVYLFCNLSECILLLFTCISSLLLLFFCRPMQTINTLNLYVVNPANLQQHLMQDSTLTLIPSVFTNRTAWCKERPTVCCMHFEHREVQCHFWC